MPLTSSSLRDRRLANRQIETKQQFVIFWIRQAWFGIPIKSMHRAIPIEIDIPIITQAGAEIPIINISDRLFPTQKPSIDMADIALNFGDVEVALKRSLILLQGKSLLGILIDSQPILQRILDSEFMPLPKDYEIQFNPELITSMTPASLQDGINRPEIFLLNPDLLLN